MKQVYLEPNAINRAQDAGVGGADLRANFASKDIMPIVGIHTIYELSRAFLNPDLVSVGQRNFEIIRDLAPKYAQPANIMLGQELDHFIGGIAIEPLLAHHSLRDTKEEVDQLASGVLREKGQIFITDREAEIRSNFPPMCAGFIAKIDWLRTTNPEIFNQLRSFEDVVSHLESDVPLLIEGILQGRARPSEAAGITEALDGFPVLRASVRANLYLTFVCIRHKIRPGFDKLDDSRHAIEAAYFDALVTNDAQLTNNAPKIAPGLAVLP